MRIRTIFLIASFLLLFQVAPLIISMFSVDFKSALISDAFGSNFSSDAVQMFDTFALVVSSMVIGIVFLIIGSLSIRNLKALRRLSFLLFVIMGFFARQKMIFGLSFVCNLR